MGSQPDWSSAPSSDALLPWFAADLLPAVRRTLQMGVGPTWLVRVIQSAGVELLGRAVWTDVDEQMARKLAGLATRLLLSADHGALWETVSDE
jgi:hypothetical protein